MTTPLKPIIPGDDYPLKFAFADANGNPENQTGATLRVVVKKKMSDADSAALSDFTVVASSPDAEAGIIEVTIPRAQTRNYPQKAPVFVQARRVLGGVYQSPLLVRLEVVDSVIDDD